jgi:hypothetical protein
MQTLTAKKQSEMIIRRMRGIPERIKTEVAAPAAPVLADLLPLRRSLPASPGAFATCRLDEAGRIRLAGITELLRWVPGELAVEVQGEWVLIGSGPAPAGPTPACRRRQVVRLDGTDRITLPRAIRHLIRIDVDETVFTATLPETGRLALIHPAAVLFGAPLC